MVYSNSFYLGDCSFKEIKYSNQLDLLVFCANSSITEFVIDLENS